MSAALIGLVVGLVLSMVILWSMGAFDMPDPLHGKPFGLSWKECAVIVLVVCATCMLLAGLFGAAL